MQSSVVQDLLAANSQWAQEVNARDPKILPTLAEGQQPGLLWLGCSDSRVPESVITAAKPGTIFVHRNIANQFHLTDDSALSVLDYAVGALGVTQIAVVGHTRCGGADACLNPPPALTPPLTRWLTPLVQLARDLESGGGKVSLQQLVEANVKAQVENITKTTTITNAWNAEREGNSQKNVIVRGWVYELETGLIRDLGISVGRDGPISKEKDTPYYATVSHD